MPLIRGANQTGALGLNWRTDGIDYNAAGSLAGITQPFTGNDKPQTEAARASKSTGGIMPAFIGLIAVVAILGYAERKMNDGKPDPTVMGVSIFNIAATGAMASIFILTLKVLVNLRPIPGLTQLANAI